MKRVYFAIILILSGFAISLWVLYNTVPDYSKYFQKINVIKLEEPEGNFIGRTGEIAITEDSHIILCDQVSTKIIVYSKDGRFLRKIGSMGEKPGAFLQLYGMAVQDSLICGYDHALHQVTVFDYKGNVKHVFKTEDEGAFPYGSTIAFSRQGTILCNEAPKVSIYDPEKPFSFPWLVCEYDLNGQRIRTFGKYDQSTVGNTLAYMDPNFPYVIGKHIEDEVYLGLTGIPKILVVDQNRNPVDVIDITTPITRPLKRSAKRNKVNLDDTPLSTNIASLSILEKEEILLVNQLKITGNPRKRGNRFFYLSAFDLAQDNQPIVTDIPLPFDKKEKPFLPVMAIGPDDLIYILESDEPQNFTIGVYRFVRPTQASGTDVAFLDRLWK